MNILAFFGALLLWCMICATVTVVASVLLAARREYDDSPLPEREPDAELWDIWREEAA